MEVDVSSSFKIMQTAVRDDILSFRWKFDLICNVKLFFLLPPPPLSLSDQNSKKNFTQIWMKIQVTVDGGGYWHLTKMWSGVQFQWINKTSRVHLSGYKCYKS